MSDIFARAPFLSALRTGMFNQVGRGGPRRLVVIVGVGGLMVAAVIGAGMINYQPKIESLTAKMPPINPLPGGLHGDPAQDALLRRHGGEKAEQAAKSGQSYTPPMPASVPLQEPVVVTEVGVTSRELGAPLTPALARNEPEAVNEASVGPVLAPPPAYVPPESPHMGARIEHVNSTGSGEVDPAMQNALNDLYRGWDGHPPRTDIVITPAADVEGDYSANALPRTRNEQNSSVSSRAPAAGAPSPVARIETILVPAGRGIYAHTVLAVSSDTGGPIVLEADTGPLAGDRMIGSFSKNGNDRLIVRVSTIEHRGQSLDVRGLVVAPDTMETAVASSVDEHYLERFALPAAAAFVSGLGQAIALSNATTQVSPFGGSVTQFGQLNFKQQLGVAAGAAGQQVGQTLQQETPKGPTVNLAANVSVGVMFLSNVVLPANVGATSAVYK